MPPLARPLLALALLLGAHTALAAPIAPPVPPTAAVAPGAEVVTVLPALPSGVYECELFLVPEGGAPIRVSAELHAGAREVHWRMPAVAARRARLLLRAGDARDEMESAPSAAFALAPLPESELARLRTGRSEAGAPLASGACATPSGFAAAPERESLSPAHTLAAAAESAPTPLDTPSEASAARTDAVVRALRPAFLRHDRSTTPAYTPLRN